MIRRSRILEDQEGFNLVEVMIAIGTLSITGLTVMSLAQATLQDSAQLRAIRVIQTARSSIEAAMKNPAAWRQTVVQNASFACALPTAAGCNLAAKDSGYYDFVLFSAVPGAKITFDATDPTTRHSIQGGPCPAGTGSPDSQCPIKYMARWKPICQTYPCKNPTLDIKISLALEFGGNAPPLNTQKYEYSSVRTLDDASLQSACLILNGTYNSVTGTCYPKNAGRSCAALGKPAEIVTAVASDGSITCAPLYVGVCNPTTQVMGGISSTGVAQCVPRVQPANCPVNCVGGWGACSAACGGGTQTYGVITAAANGGAACTVPAPGATQACNTNPCPVNCAGAWSGCSQPCGGGMMTYTITTPAAFGGTTCSNNNGDTQTCNTQACLLSVDCVGSWSSCSPATGTRTFTVSQAPQNGGAACPNPMTQDCRVDCVGSWGGCTGSPSQFKAYSWTTPPLNGGTACAYRNGQTSSSGCPGWVGIPGGYAFSGYHNRTKCKLGGGAEIIAPCGLAELGQLVQCCDHHNSSSFFGHDCYTSQCRIQ